MGIVGKIGEMCWDEGKIEKNTDRRLAGSTDGCRERWVDGRMDAQRMMVAGRMELGCRGNISQRDAQET